jgi:hypothetical protein
MLTAPYRILTYRDWPCLLCLVCNRISHRPQDIAALYCAHCDLFLGDLPDDYPAPTTHGRAPGLLLHGAEVAREEPPNAP